MEGLRPALPRSGRAARDCTRRLAELVEQWETAFSAWPRHEDLHGRLPGERRRLCRRPATPLERNTGSQAAFGAFLRSVSGRPAHHHVPGERGQPGPGPRAALQIPVELLRRTAAACASRLTPHHSTSALRVTCPQFQLPQRMRFCGRLIGNYGTGSRGPPGTLRNYRPSW
jgi:hypothetical protein